MYHHKTNVVPAKNILNHWETVNKI